MNKKTNKNEADCWLFLDCKMMTGEPPQKCPNHQSCKHNALHTQNRWCFLPCQVWIPEMDQLFEVPTLEVLSHLDPEAKEAGYGTAIDIFYNL